MVRAVWAAVGENQVMPRTLRASAGGWCYQALSRGKEWTRVFHDAGDCHAFVAATASALLAKALPTLSFQSV